jgi:hypothetical protein
MMRHHLGCLVIIASTLAFAATAPAQTQIVITGIGSHSCASFLNIVNGTQPALSSSLTYPNGQTWFDEHRLYGEWLLGFVSALNTASDDAHQINVDGPGIELWLRNWCQAHPADSVVWAASAFVKAMRPR